MLFLPYFLNFKPYFLRNFVCFFFFFPLLYFSHCHLSFSETLQYYFSFYLYSRFSPHQLRFLIFSFAFHYLFLIQTRVIHIYIFICCIRLFLLYCRLLYKRCSPFNFKFYISFPALIYFCSYFRGVFLWKQRWNTRSVLTCDSIVTQAIKPAFPAELLLVLWSQKCSLLVDKWKWSSLFSHL